MIVLDIGQTREARYWQEILAIAVFPPLRRIERVIDTAAASMSKRDATLEVLVPTGARALYGLLGGSYEPNETGQLRIIANVGARTGPIFLDSLAGTLDEVHVGLPEEYGEAVLDGLVAEQLRANLLPSGTFTIVCAAHGLVGSSSDFFRRLARGLIRAVERQTMDVAELSLAIRGAMGG